MQPGQTDIAQMVHELYGSGAAALRGILHVCSSVRAADGGLHVIKIGPHAPTSTTDFFVLNLWRAHADAIVSSGQLLRAEPGLSHTPQGPYAAQLERYRVEVLEKTQPPWAAFLTRGAALPLDHRVWSDRSRNLVLTVPPQAERLQSELGDRAEVVGLEGLDVRVATDWLMERGAKTVLIEAGPRTANRLYDAPAKVDHLLLSRCEAPIDPAAIGGALPDDAQLFAGLQRVSQIEREEQSGRWQFEHWARAKS